MSDREQLVKSRDEKSVEGSLNSRNINGEEDFNNFKDQENSATDVRNKRIKRKRRKKKEKARKLKKKVEDSEDLKKALLGIVVLLSTRFYYISKVLNQAL